MTRKTPAGIISGHNDDVDPEATAQTAMYAVWDKLGNKAPKNREALAALMIDCFVAPKLDYSPSASERYDLENEADDRLRSLVMSSRAILRTLGRSRDVHVLPFLLDSRLSDDSQDEATRLLIEVEAAIHTLANTPPLPPRPNRKRPNAVKDPYLRAMVRAIYWYVDRFDPEASPRLLAEHTIRALGHRPKSLARHLEEVRKSDDWRQADFGWWDNYPDCAPRLAA